MTSKALTGLKVIEYCRFVAGPFCAKLLADMGADVVKIEQPRVGDPARARGPFPNDLPHPEKSALFLYLNTNKRGITLDAGTPSGSGLLQELIKQADILIEDLPPTEAASLGLGFEALSALNPRLIVTSVTPFGTTGPYASYKAYPLNVCHSGAEGYVLPGSPAFDMFPDRPPLKLGGHAVEYDSGMAAAVGTMAAVFSRELWGKGQHVDVSKQEVQMALNRVSFATYFSEQIVQRRSIRKYKYGGMYRTKDGYIILRPTEDRHWKALTEAMGDPALAEDPRFKERPARVKYGKEFNQAIEDWTSRHTQYEVFEAAKRVGSPVGLIATAKDVMESEQIRGRGYFQDVDHPEAGRWKYPSAPYQFSRTPWSAGRPAPLLGQHNEDIYCGQLGFTKEELCRLAEQGVV